MAKKEVDACANSDSERSQVIVYTKPSASADKEYTGLMYFKEACNALRTVPASFSGEEGLVVEAILSLQKVTNL